MNHIHRLVWNTATSTWVAVAENARGRGKGSSRKLVAAALSLTLAAGSALAAPAGGAVTSGIGSISQSGAVTTIQQATPNLSLNWNSFNIGKTETVNFVQPSTSAVAVNRILDTNASQILGRLNANGQVYLINPNGILFGQDSVVNVGGLFASSTGANAFITNNGSLIANGGGSIKLEAANVVNTGLIQAQTVGTQQGSIILLGNMSTGTTTVGGTLDASAPNGGNGGFIETSAAHVKIAPGFHISTTANTGKTGSWLIDPKDFTISETASGTVSSGTPSGDISNTTLQNALIGSNVTILSSQGSTAAGAGDINVNAPVAWTAHTLTLTAAHSINVNAVMTASGTSALVLNTSTANGTAAAVPGGAVNMGFNADGTFKGRVDFDRSGSGLLTINGIDYTVIRQLGLVGSTNPLEFQGINALPAGFYALGASLDATSRVVSPIKAFSGTFNGLGHTISNVVMQASGGLGLFDINQSTSVIENIGLVGGDVKGGVNTGGLVGYNWGSISNSYNTGTVRGQAGTGGLVGWNQAGTVSNSHASGAVLGDVGVGGLIGYNQSGLIINNYAAGTVTSTGAQIGGLVGQSVTGDIVSSYATGVVKGGTDVGGLLGGTTTGKVLSSYATGDVTGTTSTGGLLGKSTVNVVSQSYATGNVIGTSNTGGLVGITAGGMIEKSYATGKVTGSTGTGGLVGLTTYGGISISYATGNVSGTDQTGGLVGSTTGPIDNSYASGNVVGVGIAAGGLVGLSTRPINNSYASGGLGATTTTTMGLVGTYAAGSSAVGSYYDNTRNPNADTNATPLTTADMHAPAPTSTSFTGWGQPVWTFDVGYAPVLTALIKNFTITANSASKTYNGAVYSGAFSVGAYDSALKGTLKYAAGATTAVNAGSYLITPSGLDINPQYKVTYVSGALVISPALLSVSTQSVIKTYDSTLNAIGTAYVAGGTLFGGDLLTGGSFAFANKNVGNGNKVVNVSGVTVGTILNNPNYLITYTPNSTSTITPAELQITGVTASVKVYDGSTFATLSGAAAVAKLGSDVVTLAGTITGAFADKNAGGAKPVTVSGYTLGGADAANYTLLQPTGVTTTISPALISVSTTKVTKTYDGTTSALGTAIVVAGGLVGGDTLTGGTFAFTDPNVGSGNKTVKTTGVSVKDGNGGNNYTVIPADNTVSTIKKIGLTVLTVDNTTAENKVYDGSTVAILTGGTLIGAVIPGEDVTLIQSGTFASKNVGAGIVVTANDSLGGAQADNYDLTQPTGLKANITARPLVVTAIASNKIYDGTTLAQVSLSDNRIANEVLNLSFDSANVNFSDKNVANAKVVSVSGISLSGLDKDNYSLSSTPTTALANITAAKITVGAKDSTKTYNNLLNATATPTLTGGTLFNGDTLSGGTFAYTDPNVGSGTKTVTTKDVTVGDGVNTGNYEVSYASNSTSSITPLSLLVKGVSVSAKPYDGTTAATYSGVATTDAFLNDQVAVSGGSVTFLDAKAGLGKSVLASGFSLSGTGASNYQIVQPTGLSADISPAFLLVNVLNAKALDKVYDGTTTASVMGGTLVGVQANDVVTLNQSGNFASKNAGNAIAVTATDTLGGADAANYQIVQPTGLRANITQAPITLTTLSVKKFYDANLQANGQAVIASGTLFANDSLSGGVFNFADKNVGNGNKVVIASGVTVGEGGNNSNYAIAYANNTSSTITPAEVVITGVAASNKTYDATTRASLIGVPVIAALGQDQVSVQGPASAQFIDSEIGLSKAVSVSGYTLGGIDSGNYTVRQPSGLVADISEAKKPDIRPYAIDQATPFNVSSPLKVSMVFSADVSTSADTGTSAQGSEQATPFSVSNALKVTRVVSAEASAEAGSVEGGGATTSGSSTSGSTNTAEENNESSEIRVEKKTAILQIVDGGIRLPPNILVVSEDEKRRQIQL